MLYKKIGKDKSVDHDAAPLPNNDDAQMKKLMDEIKKLETLMEETKTENGSLRDQLKEEKDTAARMTEANEKQKTDDASALKKAEEKMLNLVKEREDQCGQLVELRTALQQLEVANHSLQQRADEAVAEVRRIHEGRILTQMAASPLLSSEPQADVGEDGDDGWGSPEPARNQQAAPKHQEEDGWGGWEQEDAGEGWGGWEEETGRRGSAPAFPEGPKPECESMGGEREADLEDGWGDDSSMRC